MLIIPPIIRISEGSTIRKNLIIPIKILKLHLYLTKAHKTLSNQTETLTNLSTRASTAATTTILTTAMLLSKALKKTSTKRRMLCEYNRFQGQTGRMEENLKRINIKAT